MQNKGFTNAFKGELYKIFGNKSFISLIIACVVIFIVFTLVFNFAYSIMNEALDTVANAGTEVDEQEEASQPITQEDYDTAIRLLEQQLEDLKEELQEAKPYQRMADRNTWVVKSQIALLKYLKAHPAVNIDNVNYFSTTMTGLNAESYVIFMLGIMSSVFIIYAIVIVGKSMAGEIQNGAMKMQLLRPISRDAMVSAKLLSSFVVTTGLFIITTIILCIVGAIAFKFSGETYLMVVNAEKVVEISSGGMIVINLIGYIFRTFAFIVLTMCMGTVLKQSGAIALPIVMYLLADEIELLLGYIYIGYIGFSINTAWTMALTTAGPVLNYMNLYSMLAISIAWITGLTAGSYLLFRNKEIN